MSKNNNKQRELLIFVPSIEDGGVEKILLISNYFSKKEL